MDNLLIMYDGDQLLLFTHFFSDLKGTWFPPRADTAWGTPPTTHHSKSDCFPQ